MHLHPTQQLPLKKSRPPFKWLGGKQRLLPQLLPLLPPGAKRLIEPFVGAGSVFLASNYDSYVINDANPDLMSAWVALQARPREFLERASSLFVEENKSRVAYEALRNRFNEETDTFERAVMLPYLNRFGFNGLFRVNAKGVFNVPYGRPKKVPNFPWDAMEAASQKLQGCLVLNGGFCMAVELAGNGDVVYCDPPYVDYASTSFTQYTSNGFGMAQQQELVRVCKAAVERGAIVLISNHDTPESRDLYAGWRIHEMTARRTVSAEVRARRIVREIVACLA